MYQEELEISEESAAAINAALHAGRRIVAAGTTVVRTLETQSVWHHSGKWQVEPGRHLTDMFIYPGYDFRIVDALLTNFHLPRSTLLMLVSALAGREAILRAYRHAIEARYRFYSFGDAMLII